MKLDLTKNNPVEMVGDGKEPNRFWVTASTDFDYYHKEDGAGMIDYAGDIGLMKDHGIESKSIPVDAVFSELAEAVAYAEQVAEDRMPAEPAPDAANRVTIEDRLQGEVWQRVLVAYPRKWGGWYFEAETNDDTDKGAA